MSLYYFWAPWCGPCKQFGPILEAALENYPNLTVEKRNIDENLDLGLEFGVRNVPTLVFVAPDGRIDKMSGLVGSDSLRVFLKNADKLSRM